MKITDKSCPLRSSVQSPGGETPSAGLLTKVVCELGEKIKMSFNNAGCIYRIIEY